MVCEICGQEGKVWATAPAPRLCVQCAEKSEKELNEKLIKRYDRYERNEFVYLSAIRTVKKSWYAGGIWITYVFSYKEKLYNIPLTRGDGVIVGHNGSGEWKRVYAENKFLEARKTLKENQMLCLFCGGTGLAIKSLFINSEGEIFQSKTWVTGFQEGKTYSKRKDGLYELETIN